MPQITVGQNNSSGITAEMNFGLKKKKEKINMLWQMNLLALTHNCKCAVLSKDCKYVWMLWNI